MAAQKMSVDGRNELRILENCSLEGIVTGNTNVGGIVGENRADGIVLTCYNKGTIGGTNEVSIICGMNRGILQNCEKMKEKSTTRT